MLVIDGSRGEGGGQILRSSLALSILLQKPIRIINIRAKRPNPGLKAQHLTSIKAVQQITNSKVKHAFLNSKNLEFYPGRPKNYNIKIDIGTAGSITLVLQTILPIALAIEKELKILVKGGTHVKWSPGYDYFEKVFLWFLERFGIKVKSKLIQYGFYPKGNGVVEVEILPCLNLKKINLEKRGKLNKIEITSIATKTLQERKVAERQASAFLKNFYYEGKLKKEMKYVNAFSDGSAFFASLCYEKTRLAMDMIGEKKLRAEEIGKKVAEELKKEEKSNNVIDRFAADQLIIYAALSKSKIKFESELSMHAKTNLWLIEKFLGKTDIFY